MENGASPAATTEFCSRILGLSYSQLLIHFFVSVRSENAQIMLLYVVYCELRLINVYVVSWWSVVPFLGFLCKDCFVAVVCENESGLQKIGQRVFSGGNVMGWLSHKFRENPLITSRVDTQYQVVIFSEVQEQLLDSGIL